MKRQFKKRKGLSDINFYLSLLMCESLFICCVSTFFFDDQRNQSINLVNLYDPNKESEVKSILFVQLLNSSVSPET